MAYSSSLSNPRDVKFSYCGVILANTYRKVRVLRVNHVFLQLNESVRVDKSGSASSASSPRQQPSLSCFSHSASVQELIYDGGGKGKRSTSNDVFWGKSVDVNTNEMILLRTAATAVAVAASCL